MNAVPQLLTDHIDIWTAAETEKKSGRGRASGNAASVYGIKKLRELILELAVRGKLVPQDAKEEPASELIKRIQIERSKLVAEGKIKKVKPLAAISETEKPSKLPSGWEWSTLSAISQVNPRNSSGDDLPVSFITMTMIEAKFNSSHDQEHRLWKEIKQGFTHFAEGDIGIAKITPCFENSKACVFSGLLNKIGAGTTELHVVRPINATLAPRYVLAYLKSPQFLLNGESKMTGTAGQKRLPKEFVESNPFPLPPLAEQHRIVAKVDELMALCDQLESQHRDAADAHEQLVSHLLGTLTQLQSAADFHTSWQRIAAHFDTLFTTEASIDALKQTLLQLAVMGKLVAQDANDEPASELLMRIRAEKNKLIAEGLGKKAKTLSKIMDNEKLFPLPAGWEFSRKGDIFNFLNGYAFKSEWFQPTGVRLLRNVNISHGKSTWNDTARISDAHAVDFNSFRLNTGDIVLSLDRPIITTGLKYAVISEDDIPCLLLQRVAKISSYAEALSPGYFPLWLNSLFFLKNIDPGRSNGVPHISTTQLSNMVFALPPIKEQRRIVAKTDELMAMCDKLRTSITTIKQQQKKLADALVEQVVAT